MKLSSILCTLFLVFVKLCFAYHDGSVGSRGAHCWQRPANAVDKTWQGVEITCPSTFRLDYITAPPVKIYENVRFAVVIEATCGALLRTNDSSQCIDLEASREQCPHAVPPGGVDDGAGGRIYDDIKHVNIHACVLDGMMDCTPFVSGELVSTSPAKGANVSTQWSDSIQIPRTGLWRIIYHVELTDGLHYVIGSTYDVAPVPDDGVLEEEAPSLHCWQRCGDNDLWKRIEVDCPPDAAMHLLTPLPDLIYAGDVLELLYTVSRDLINHNPGPAAADPRSFYPDSYDDMIHMNVHACLETVERCEPFLTGPLVTLSDSVPGNFSEPITDRITLPPGRFVIIAHVRTWDGLELHLEFMRTVYARPTTSSPPTTAASTSTSSSSSSSSSAADSSMPIVDFTTTDRGGIGGAGIAGIVLGVLAGLGLAVLAYFCLVRPRLLAAEAGAAGANGPLQVQEPTNEEIAAEQERMESADPLSPVGRPRQFKDTKCSMSKRQLSWGLAGSHAPVDTPLRDTLLLINEDPSVDYYFSVTEIPVAKNRFLITFTPSCGVVKRNSTLAVNATLTFYATTAVNETCTLHVRVHHSKGSASALSRDTAELPLRLQAESALSTRLAWDDLHFDRKSKKLLGSGGYGKVVRATWRGTDVAVKFLASQQLDEEQREELNRELEVMRGLRHPNVAVFIGACLEPERMSIVTEYIRGGNLWDRLVEGIEDDLLRVKFCLDTAKGVSYMHSSGIWHRDIKPDNLLCVSEDPLAQVNVKLIDFGTSRGVSKFGEVTKTQRGTSTLSRAATSGKGTLHTKTVTSAIGTPGYMAVEVLKNEPYTAKCDVFSFGITMYEIELQRPAWKEYFGDADSQAGTRSGSSKKKSRSAKNATADEVVANATGGGSESAGAQMQRTPRGSRLDFDDMICSGVRPTIPKDMREPFRSLVPRCWVDEKSRPEMAEVRDVLERAYTKVARKRSGYQGSRPANSSRPQSSKAGKSSSRPSSKEKEKGSRRHSLSAADKEGDSKTRHRRHSADVDDDADEIEKDETPPPVKRVRSKKKAKKVPQTIDEEEVDDERDDEGGGGGEKGAKKLTKKVSKKVSKRRRKNDEVAPDLPKTISEQIIEDEKKRKEEKRKSKEALAKADSGGGGKEVRRQGSKAKRSKKRAALASDDE